MEEKIGLKEIILVLLKGKWIIAASTAVIMLFTAVLSFFIMDPVYESKVTVSVNNGPAMGTTVGETDGYFNEVIKPRAYIERLKSAPIIEKAIEKSGLQHYTISSIQNNLTLENQPDTNLVSIELKAKSPADAQKMLSAILTSVQESLLSEIKGRIQEDVKYYSAQAKAEKENLEVLLKEYSKQAEMLELPNSLLLDAAISYNNQYMLNLDQNRLGEMKNLSESNLIELNEVSNKVKTVSAVYEEYSNKERQLKAFAEVFRIDNKVLIIYPPTENESAVSPKPLINLVMALVIGLMVGVGMVLLRYFWKHV